MKKFLALLSLIAVLGIAFSVSVFADGGPDYSAAAAAAGLPSWLPSVMQTGLSFLSAFPKIQAVLMTVLCVVGVVAAAFTALATAAQAILAIPEIAARFAGAHALADKIKGLADRLVPKLKFLSMYNVQKKPDAPSQGQ
jgi:hypothetical protein